MLTDNNYETDLKYMNLSGMGTWNLKWNISVTKKDGLREDTRNLVGRMERTQFAYLADLTIISEDETANTRSFEVHKVLLARLSPVFEAMFKDSWKESAEKTLTIDGFGADVVNSFIEFCYQGEVKDEAYTIELLAMANHYMVSQLKTYIINI